MNMLATTGGSHEFVHQARKCRSMGSPFIASILDAVGRQWRHAPLSVARLQDLPGDPAAAAVTMRVNGALHALARSGTPKYLADLYRGEHDDFDGAIAVALSEHDQFIADWIRRPTQTNEVARAAAIMAALMTASRRWAMPFQLLELGSSCGLNLNLAHYAYRLGSLSVGDPLSAVRIDPHWRGEDPTFAPVTLAETRGVDLNPLDASDAAHRERLRSFVWADQPERSRRLEGALLMATLHPPRVDRGDAGAWLAQRLAEHQEPGQCRAIVHTMFMQYLSDLDRQGLAGMIEAAGARATAERPLVWIGFEWTAERSAVELRLTQWPTGETVVLAHCDPYGDWLEWCAPPLV